MTPADHNSDHHSTSIPTNTGDFPDVPGACCKVQRVSAAYELKGIDNELRRRYDDGDATLHELAAYVNDRVTAVALDAVNNPTDSDPGTVRAALQNKESISPTRRDDLRATVAGKLDVELLTDSFVSHETVRRHLNEHLEISTSQGGFTTLKELEESLLSYQDQYEDGVESALERGGETGLIDGDQFRVFSTRVECQRCTETYRLAELLDAGGCDCTESA